VITHSCFGIILIASEYRALDKKFELNLPKYPGWEQIVELPPVALASGATEEQKL